MSESEINLDEEIRIWQEKLFKRSIRRRRKLERVSALIGNTSNLHCLEICAGDGIISASLRALGGSWKTAVSSNKAGESLHYSLKEKISRIENGKLPFDDGVFDRVVIVDALKGIQNDHEFIHECHRVLKNDGWVVINETRRTPFSATTMIRRILHILPMAKGQRRNGYMAGELFNILKDGFDVPETIIYSNGLTEAAAALGEFAQFRLLQDDYWLIRKAPQKDLLFRYRRLHSLAGFFYPLMWILSALEFLPGHQLLIKSRRRHWRPRRQPKLIDGRSIAEAAINTKIGTAAPF
ncbi:MAG: methyltransferase domain-containing protein [Pontiellaceae bacterium]|nr:methyltransferase domain-containing protein [Pontiellaceae bacterium]MBN2786070.1 methyltransferase domain-containing protein [Pontiellaceae bacterium]